MFYPSPLYSTFLIKEWFKKHFYLLNILNFLVFFIFCCCRSLLWHSSTRKYFSASVSNDNFSWCFCFFLCRCFFLCIAVSPIFVLFLTREASVVTMWHLLILHLATWLTEAQHFISPCFLHVRVYWRFFWVFFLYWHAYTCMVLHGKVYWFVVTVVLLCDFIPFL